ncbi:TolC family protein [Deferribacteraceae bacterium V6Fe1]|nr:TolC family protein [Deferribacteraceae bacterium V6Fe1]
MRKVAFFLLLLLVAFANLSYATTIQELLNALKKQPDTQVDAVIHERFDLEKEKVTAKLFPQINIIGSYEYHNSPTNLRPMPPTEINPKTDSIPFSKSILRYGVEFNMPLFVKEIYTTKEKVMLEKKKFGLAKKINFIAREATVVNINSALEYVNKSIEYVDKRIQSLNQTKSDINVKVDNGRLPKSELYNIEGLIFELEKQKNNLLSKRIDLLSDIYVITGIKIEQPVPMEINKEDFGGESPQIKMYEKDIEVSNLDYKITKEKYLPSLYLGGSYVQNTGTAYNTDDHIERTYGSIMVNVKIPLFDRYILKDIRSKKIDIVKSQLKLAKIKREINSDIDKISSQIAIVNNNLEIAKSKIDSAEKLLEIGKVAYRNNRMTVEEYLRYEVNLLQAQKDFYETMAEKWKLLSQKALLNGVDLLEVIK